MRHINSDSHWTQTTAGPNHAEHHDSGDGGDPEGREAVVHEHGDSLHGLAQTRENKELIFVSEKTGNLPEIFFVVCEV